MAKMYPHKGLKDVLRQIKSQALKDVSWIQDQIPYDTLPEIFLFLKSVTRYKKDPKRIELIHRPKSLFYKNYHGVSGAGDCDCFTALSVCTLLAKGYKPNSIQIVLVGREPDAPRHIYARVNGITFDLTNSMLGIERKYPYRQFIPINKI